jgi:hypothetical protein
MNACWQRWRRDLLFALAGVIVASAVLIPVGWSQVRAERQRAEAAEEAARVERERAEREEAKLEKLSRDEARYRQREMEMFIEHLKRQGGRP